MKSNSEQLRPFASCHDHPKRRTCMLMVTHGCNLNCTYCYEKFKNGAKRMDTALAKEIILKEIEIVKNNERFEELEVDFMGGEPLLRFDLIKEIVEWLETGVCPIPFVCFATTNGTLLTPQMKDWFREHRKFACLGASYDGVGSSQEANRGDAAAHVDLEFFHEVWPKQGFKMTISKESLPFLCDSFIDAYHKGYRIDASLAQGVDWNLEDAKIYQQQLRLLMEFYRRTPLAQPCDLLSRGLYGIGEKSERQIKYCGSGTYMATYDVDGTMYGCHMFTPLVLGERAVKHSDFVGWSDDQILTDSACQGCGFMNWCPTCIGFNLLDRGEVQLRDHRWCAMIAVQAMCACEFQLDYFSLLSQQQELNQEEAATLQSALQAYEYLATIDIDKKFPQ